MLEEELQEWRGPAMTLELSVVMEGAEWTWARGGARGVQCLSVTWREWAGLAVTLELVMMMFMVMIIMMVMVWW